MRKLKLKMFENFSDMRNHEGIATLRSIRNKLYVIIIILCNIHIVYAQQEISQDKEIDEFHRMGQDLVDYLDAGRYFEAKEQFGHIIEKYDDTTDVYLEDYYKLQMKYFERQFDISVFYEQKMIDDGLFEGPVVLNLYYRRCKTYTELHDYEKAIQICHKAKDFIDENADKFDDKYLQKAKSDFEDEENIIRRKSLEPTIEIKRNNASNAVPILRNDTLFKNHLPIEISYNNHNNVRTVFDTGAEGYFLFNKDEAEKIGVRKWHIYDNDSTGTFNGVQASGYLGIIDSLQIANIKMYNVPVVVFDFKSFYNLDTINIESDKKEKIKSLLDSMKVFMGLGAMNLIGRFILDGEKDEIIFPMEEEHYEIERGEDMFCLQNKIYTRAKVNNLPITVHIDTGSSEYLSIDSVYFENHKKDIPVDSLINTEKHGTAMLHSVFVDSIQIIVRNPDITFADRKIDYASNDSTMVESIELIGNADGRIGTPFIRSLGKKVLFDLRNMRLEVLKED